MDCNKCKFWTGSVCADPNDWVNESGDHVCRFQVGAISLDEKLFNEHLQSELENLRRQNAELERKNKILWEHFHASTGYTDWLHSVLDRGVEEWSPETVNDSGPTNRLVLAEIEVRKLKEDK